MQTLTRHGRRRDEFGRRGSLSLVAILGIEARLLEGLTTVLLLLTVRLLVRHS